jgi:hypothetical protein
MSTKIYNGYKILTTDLKELYDFSIQMRNDLRKIADQLYQDWFFRSCIKMLDEVNFLEKRLDFKNVLSHVWGEYAERKYKSRTENFRDSAIDFECSWCFIPLKDKNYTLVLFYSEQPEFDKHWKTHSKLEYWGYWNNTDPDEDCSEEEWEQRKQDWDVLGYEPPITVGFSFEIYGRYQSPEDVKWEKITQKKLDKYNNREKRINWIINSIGLKCCSQFENSMSGYWEWKDWVEDTTDGQKWWAEKWKEIDGQLKDYTPEDLKLERE